MEKVQENEAVKLIRVKEGLLKLSEAYLELANKCAIIFESQRDIAAHIPDVHHMALHEMKYTAMEKVQENEAVKLIRVKEGLLKLSEAYLELANKCAIIFESQRDIAAHIPDVHHMALHEMKYTGTGAMKQAVQKAKDRVDQYHLYQYRLIPHCPSVEEPPPPYTPGYYDPTTGQPYHVPGGDEAAFGSQLPSRPPGGNNNPDWLLPRDPPAACPPSPWPPAWGSDGEEEDRLSAAMGAARLG
ncbi:hypothetical protein IscW_ISCW015663 [Ixodes scapularis]|uniref:Uncharacterized protein n=1 Tax=Ixodes scapularis TaxID=6945 RepID=B7P4I6_IXOSC|nr:hypothetical protein IscW_ISCW015663 [Ixodes scapularis]|eukprot:XP_002406040.1 hypothetical protein IscW_ISCW015663 [Ixodes scapularis]